MERRVVITAESAITPIGHGKKDIFNNFVNGVSGVKKITKHDDILEEYLHSKVYGMIDYEIAYDFSRKFTKTLAPLSYYACQVAKEVIEQSGFDKEYLSSGKVGVAFGSIHGSPTVQAGIYRAFFDKECKGYAKNQCYGLLKINGSYYCSKYYTHVRDHRQGAVLMYGMHNCEPVDRVWLRVHKIRNAGRDDMRRGR